MSVMHQEDLESRPQSLRSFLIGSAIMCVAYAIPVIGLLTWAMAAVFGLGAAMQAFMRAYRRENPRPPRKAAPVPPAPAPVTATAPTAPVETLTASPLDEPFVPVPDLPSAPGRRPTAGAADLLSYPRATFLERLAAFALDLVLIMIAAQILRLDRLFDDYPSFERNLLLLAVVYHVGFWTWKQTTARRHHLSTASRADRRRAGAVCGGAGARPDRHLLAGRRRARLLLDSQGSGAAGLARSHRRHLRREGAAQLADLTERRSWRRPELDAWSNHRDEDAADHEAGQNPSHTRRQTLFRRSDINAPSLDHPRHERETRHGGESTAHTRYEDQARTYRVEGGCGEQQRATGDIGRKHQSRDLPERHQPTSVLIA